MFQTTDSAAALAATIHQATAPKGPVFRLFCAVANAHAAALRDPDYGPATDHPHDPRAAEPDDDALTTEDALDIATDECDATPAQFADWLAKATDELPARLDYEPQDIRALVQRSNNGEHLWPWELAALMVAGPDKQALRSKRALMELYRQAHDADIKRRARELVVASGGVWDEGL